MKRKILNVSAGAVLILNSVGLCSMLKTGNNELEFGFFCPPSQYRPEVFWEWCNGNVNRAGVTSDLEAMKRVGLGGGKIFNVGQGPEGPVRFASEEWFDLVAFSCQEAGRLGLTLGLNITEGFNAAGGPWITPEKSMQQVIWSETEVSGPGWIHVKPVEPNPVYFRSKVDFYRDIRIFAVPSVGESRLADYNEKTGLPDHHPHTGLVMKPTPSSSIRPEDIILSSDVIDITDCMDQEGNLEWKAPAGKWTILRMGRASTGSISRPAHPKTRGLECDKLSRKAVQFQFDSICRPLLEMDGVEPGRNLTFLGIDSWEAGAQNWSPVLPDEFETRRGYSLYPWLPVLTGRVVNSIEVSERFLWDFRRTIADCIHDNFFVYLQEICEQYGMEFEAESFTRATFNGAEVTESIGRPTSTFWQRPGQLKQSGQPYRQARWASSAAHVSGTKRVGAEAFTANKDNSGWVNHPWTLKPLGDHAYCNGVNQFLFHCFALQPWEDKVHAIHKPGMSFGWWGVQYSQHNTWWEQSLAWQQYQTRCNYLLQQGLFAADVVCLTGEEAPGYEMDLSPEVDLPIGYDWDMCSRRAVIEKMSVQDGMICLSSGMKYRLLVLPSMKGITLPLLEKVKELVGAGGHVLVDSRPDCTRGLTDYPACDQRVRDLVAEIWQQLDGSTVKEQRFGQGTIYWGLSPEEVLRKLSVQRDLIVQTDILISKYPFNYLHRYTEHSDIYFIAGFRDCPSAALFSFRVQGKQPELWYPDTGRIEECAVYEEKNGRTVVPLQFDPYESVFVVFRNMPDTPSVTRVERDGQVVLSTENYKDISLDGPVHLWKENDAVAAEFSMPGEYRLTFPNGAVVEKSVAALAEQTLEEDWKVSFPEDSGAPESVKFSTLIPWEKHRDEEIRYFSGTASYQHFFTVSPNNGDRTWLDLGDVQVIADVFVNGKALGTLWKPPFRVDMTDAVKAGENRLEVRITNLWVNRLIRDEQFPADFSRDKKGFVDKWPEWLLNDTERPELHRKTFTIYQHYHGDDPLLPSGLLGPVKVLTVQRQLVPIP